MHWSYIFLALSHRFVHVQFMLLWNWWGVKNKQDSLALTYQVLKRDYSGGTRLISWLLMSPGSLCCQVISNHGNGVLTMQDEWVLVFDDEKLQVRIPWQTYSNIIAQPFWCLGQNYLIFCENWIITMAADAMVPIAVLGHQPLWYCLCSVHWGQILSPEWRCSWSSANRDAPTTSELATVLLPTKVRLL